MNLSPSRYKIEQFTGVSFRLRNPSSIDKDGFDRPIPDAANE